MGATTPGSTNVAGWQISPFWWYLPGKMGIFHGLMLVFNEGNPSYQQSAQSKVIPSKISLKIHEPRNCGCSHRQNIEIHALRRWRKNQSEDFFCKAIFFPYFQPLMRYGIGVAGCGFGHFFFVGEKHVLQTREKPTQRKMDWKLFFFSGDRINNLRKGSNRTWVNIPQVCPKYTYERISSINRWLRVVLGNFPRVCWSFLRFVPRWKSTIHLGQQKTCPNWMLWNMESYNKFSSKSTDEVSGQNPAGLCTLYRGWNPTQFFLGIITNHEIKDLGNETSSVVKFVEPLDSRNKQNFLAKMGRTQNSL